MPYFFFLKNQECCCLSSRLKAMNSEYLRRLVGFDIFNMYIYKNDVEYEHIQVINLNNNKRFQSNRINPQALRMKKLQINQQILNYQQNTQNIKAESNLEIFKLIQKQTTSHPHQTQKYGRRKDRKKFQFTQSNKVLPINHNNQQFKTIINAKKTYQEMIKSQLKKLDVLQSMENQEEQVEEFIVAGTVQKEAFKFERQVRKYEDEQFSETVNISNKFKNKSWQRKDEEWKWEENQQSNQLKISLLQQQLIQLRQRIFIKSLQNNRRDNQKCMASKYFYSNRRLSAVFLRWKTITSENNFNGMEDQYMQQYQATKKMIIGNYFKKLKNNVSVSRLKKLGKAVSKVRKFRISKKTLSHLFQQFVKFKHFKVNKKLLQATVREIRIHRFLSLLQKQKTYNNKISELYFYIIRNSFHKFTQVLKQSVIRKQIYQSLNNQSNQDRPLFQNPIIQLYRKYLERQRRLKLNLEKNRKKELFSILMHRKQTQLLKKYTQSSVFSRSVKARVSYFFREMNENKKLRSSMKFTKANIFLKKYCDNLFYNIEADRKLSASQKKCHNKSSQLQIKLFKSKSIKPHSKFLNVIRKQVIKLFLFNLRENAKQSKRLKLVEEVLNILHGKYLLQKSFRILATYKQTQKEIDEENADKQEQDQAIKTQSLSKMYKFERKKQFLNFLAESYWSKCRNIENITKKTQEAIILIKKYNIRKTFVTLSSNFLLKQEERDRIQQIRAVRQNHYFISLAQQLNHQKLVKYKTKSMMSRFKEKEPRQQKYRQQKTYYRIGIKEVRERKRERQIKEFIQLLRENNRINRNSIEITKLYLRGFLNKMRNSNKIKHEISSKKQKLEDVIHKDWALKFLSVQNSEVQEDENRIGLRGKYLAMRRDYINKMERMHKKRIQLMSGKFISLLREKGNSGKQVQQKKLKKLKQQIVLFEKRRVFAQIRQYMKQYKKQRKNQAEEEFSNKNISNESQIDQIAENISSENREESVQQEKIILKGQQQYIQEGYNQIEEDESSNSQQITIINTHKQEEKSDEQQEQMSDDSLENVHPQQSIHSPNNNTQKSIQFQNQHSDVVLPETEHVYDQNHQQQNSMQEPEDQDLSSLNQSNSIENSIVYSEEYFINRYNSSLLHKAFNQFKSITHLQSHLLDQQNAQLAETEQIKEEKYNLMKKCFMGLQMFTKQKSKVRKYLEEFEELDRYSFYPRSRGEAQKFRRIAASGF